jgi:uncharacterized protein (TIGR02266 family)
MHFSIDTHRTTPRAEARETTRCELNVEVDFTSERTSHMSGELYAGVSVNISEGGVFVATHFIRPIGSMLEIRFTLPDGKDAICALVEVCWTRPPKGALELPPGMGLRFAALEARDLARLKAYVKRMNDVLLYEE